MHSVVSESYYLGTHRAIEKLARTFSPDLIHAHFIYPDGVVAARIGKDLGLPVIITEHAPWNPWLVQYPRVRIKALAAAEYASRIIAVSRSLAKDIESFGVPVSKIAVIPNVIDESSFNLEGSKTSHDPGRLVFVGIVRRVKGLDVLLEALRILRDNGQVINLRIIGESFYESYARDLDEVQRLVVRLGLSGSVTFLGGMSAPEVAREIRQSAALVLPSRRETFGVVLAEALACGRPVIATRCGGPEDIVSEDVGVLVEPNDAPALAEGISRVLSSASSYDPAALNSHAIHRFGRDVVSAQIQRVYEETLAR
jgi:glycosyltransferase involved in cell wall biosynthesis